MSDDGEYILLSSCVIYVATEGGGENSLKLELERVNSTTDFYMMILEAPVTRRYYAISNCG